MRRKANRVSESECIVQIYVDRLLHPDRDANARILRRLLEGGSLHDTVRLMFLLGVDI